MILLDLGSCDIANEVMHAQNEVATNFMTRHSSCLLIRRLCFVI